eukprot:1781393-Rhodomonas_salina.3
MLVIALSGPGLLKWHLSAARAHLGAHQDQHSRDEEEVLGQELAGELIWLTVVQSYVHRHRCPETPLRNCHRSMDPQCPRCGDREAPG